MPRTGPDKYTYRLSMVNKKNTTKKKKQQRQPQQRRVANLATTSVAKHVPRMRKHDYVSSSAKALSDAISDPFESELVKFPLADNSLIPCDSQAVKLYGQTEVIMQASRTTIDIFGFPEGFHGDTHDRDPVMAPLTSGGSTQVMGVGPGGRSAWGWVQQNISASSAQEFVSPSATAPGVGALMYDDYSARLNIQSASSGTTANKARLVATGIRCSFMGRQINIEGRVQSVCLYEMPLAGLTFSAYRNDESYRNRAMGANRTVRAKCWPNCDSPVYRYLTSDVTENQLCRIRLKITDLAEGDKVLIEYVGLYEVVRGNAGGLMTPSPIVPQPAMLGNAISSHSGRDGKLAHHIVAHKIMQHPVLSRVGEVAEAALAMIGGNVAGQKFISTITNAATKVGSVSEMLAPLLLVA
jgi:hypothetical protein